MAQLFHWPVPCTICESPVEYHCNTCGDVLCNKCRDNHLKSNAGRNHDVVPYSQGIKPITSLLQCGDHPSHQCGVWCQTCNRAVCGDCVTSPQHNCHHFLKLDEKIEERRKEIKNQFEKYSQILQGWQTSFQEAEDMKDTYEKDVEQLDNDIVNRADHICRQVRETEKDLRKQLQEMKNASLGVLMDQQKMLADSIGRLETDVKELEDTLRSTDSSSILQYLTEMKTIEDTQPVDTQQPDLPSFTPGPLDGKVLEKMFGSITQGGLHGEDSRSVPKPPEPSELPLPDDKDVTSLSISEEGDVNILLEDGDSNLLAEKALAKSEPPQNTKTMTLPSKHLEESDITGNTKDWHTPAIACLKSDQAWVKSIQKRIQLVDRQGNVERTVNIDFNITDIAMTQRGDILVSDSYRNCIRSMSVKGGTIKRLFKTKWSPHGICSLPSGDIVVTFIQDKRVIQYSRPGEIIREFKSKGWLNFKSLFHYPWYVAYSQVNQQLYVCDKSEPDDYRGPGRVVSFDLTGKIRYKYTGPDPAELFTPVAICTDHSGHVLITDFINDRVHILDKGGNFLLYIMTKEQGLSQPVTIDVDGEGYAWIGEDSTRKVRVVKYTDNK